MSATNPAGMDPRGEDLFPCPKCSGLHRRFENCSQQDTGDPWSCVPKDECDCMCHILVDGKPSGVHCVPCCYTCPCCHKRILHHNWAAGHLLSCKKR